MPNTKSAERRIRNSARRHLRNQQIKTRLKTLEKNLLEQLGTGKKEDASLSLRAVGSALDKAAKTGVIHPNTAARKKSRLALRVRAGKA